MATVLTTEEREQSKPQPQVFLRLPAHVGLALDRVLAYYARRRGRMTKNDLIRELILEEDRRVAILIAKERATSGDAA